MISELCRQRAEVITWRLVAAVAACMRVARIVETHAGGGQYDTVELHLGVQPGDQRGSTYLHCNRPGSVHVFAEPAKHESRDWLRELNDGLPLQSAVDWVVDRASGTDVPVDSASGTDVPVDRRVAATTALMADAVELAVALPDGLSWEWRNGILDSSCGCKRRDDLFRAIPASDRACAPAPGDLLGLPGYRFWFLLSDGVPVLAVDPTAGLLYIENLTLDLGAPDTAQRWREAVTSGLHETPLRGSPAALAASKRAAFVSAAEDLAARVAPDLDAFRPGPALTELAWWFCNQAGEVLVVVVGPHETADVTDEVLAYALAWQGDRDLALVLPETHVGLTLERLPWIDTPVRAFTYGVDVDPRPAIIPARAEVLARAALRPLRSTDTHDLKQFNPLVEALVRRLDTHWALVPAHRSSYLAWHCLGRQVVRIARTTTGVTIQAGVAYSKPPPGETKALVLHVDEPLSSVQLAEVERRVTDAVWKRFAGHDGSHVEHRMQAALASKGLRGLDITALSREYPAWRGDGRPGYIDFLALDRGNSLHVIETKVGTADVKGVLQTLDYATWVTAHAAEIRAERNWPEASHHGQETVVLDFILAPKGQGPAVGSYLAGQLEALAGSLPWRLAIVTDPLAEAPQLLGPWRRALPPPSPLVAAPVQGPRWWARTAHILAETAL